MPPRETRPPVREGARIHRNGPPGQPGAGAHRTRRRAPCSVAQCYPQPEQQQRPPRKNNGVMAGRGRGTAGRGRGAPPIGPDDRDTIRAQLDVLRCAGAESSFEAPRASHPLLNTQAGPARGAAGHPRHARRGERRGPGPRRIGRARAAGDGPAPRGPRGRAAGGAGGLRARGSCAASGEIGADFARSGAGAGARAGARNGAGAGTRTGTGRRRRGTTGGDPDGPAVPVALAVAVARATTPSRLDTR